MIHDVIVSGAGPAGSLAAMLLARAGARVLLVDRARFPRHKLCGDTVNPGALAVLRRAGCDAADRGLAVSGMIVTGPRQARVAVSYPCGLTGRAITRAELDHAMLRQAAALGATVEEEVLVERPVVDARNGRVIGVRLRRRGGQASDLRGRMVIAADGRESRLARALRLARHPARPRRWVVGSYFANVAGLTDHGEMHVRRDCYIGVAPLPHGIANACVVTADRDRFRDAAGLLREALAADSELADRFRRAEMIAKPSVLGPLAVDAVASGVPGLLLAGDAAGFIDPMTGDGLCFALRGAQFAAEETIRALATGEGDAHARLAHARQREFAGKWRTNRALRRLVGSPAGVEAAGCATRLAAWPVERLIRYAADLGLAARLGAAAAASASGTGIPAPLHD
jgi:flavin-dependent dehydrogenase